MTIIPFPTCRAPVDLNKLILIDRFRSLVPAHRVHVFNSLSDDDQFNIAQHFLAATQRAPRAFEVDGSVVLR